MAGISPVLTSGYGVMGVPQVGSQNQGRRTQLLDQVAQLLNVDPIALAKAIQQAQQQAKNTASNGSSSNADLSSVAGQLGLSTSSLLSAIQKAVQPMHQGGHHHGGGASSGAPTQPDWASGVAATTSASQTNSDTGSTLDVAV